MIVAETSWPDAAIAIAGILFLATVISVAVWQVMATGRAGLSASREKAYRKVAEDAADAQRAASERLGEAVRELGELRTRIGELERLLKEVE